MGDFDFLVGEWDSTHHRLLKPLSGSDEWEDFTSTSRCIGVWGGAANFDEIAFPHRNSAGLTLRLYDPDRKEWSLYWADSRRGAPLDPPVVGRFVDGRGEFFGDDTYEGRPIRVRYIWSDITPTSCHWEQAFSVDGGQSWETNWLMDFTRR